MKDRSALLKTKTEINLIKWAFLLNRKFLSEKFTQKCPGEIDMWLEVFQINEYYKNVVDMGKENLQVWRWMAIKAPYKKNK